MKAAALWARHRPNGHTTGPRSVVGAPQAARVLADLRGAARGAAVEPRIINSGASVRRSGAALGVAIRPSSSLAA